MNFLKAIKSLPQKHPISTAVLLTIIGSGVAFIVSTIACLSSKLVETLQTAGITLIFGGLLITIIKWLFDDHDRQRQQREARLAFITNMLNDIKSVFDRVERARTVIYAHRSAKTYGDEMRDLIDSSVTLRNLLRALDRNSDDIRKKTLSEVDNNVDEMKKYLEKLIDEFREKYKELSQKQRLYEARVNNDLKSEALDKIYHKDIFPEEKEMWHEMIELPKLHEFLESRDSEQSDYNTKFIDPLKNASKTLREELQFIITGKSNSKKHKDQQEAMEGS